MKEKIASDLLKLEKELSTLDVAVKQISKAEKLSTETVNAIKKLQKKFGEGIEKIAKHTETTQESAQALIAQHNEQVGEVNKLLKSYLDLAGSTAELNKQIENINFPERLDKISANIAAMNTEFRAIQVEMKTLADDDTAAKNEKAIKKLNRKTLFNNIIVITMFIIVLALGYELILVKYFPQLSLEHFLPKR